MRVSAPSKHVLFPQFSMHTGSGTVHTAMVLFDTVLGASSQSPQPEPVTEAIKYAFLSYGSTGRCHICVNVMRENCIQTLVPANKSYSSLTFLGMMP